MSKSTTREIIDRIFKEPGIKYELTEFETLGKPIHEILDIQAKTGRDTQGGNGRKYLKTYGPQPKQIEKLPGVSRCIIGTSCMKRRVPGGSTKLKRE